MLALRGKHGANRPPATVRRAYTPRGTARKAPFALHGCGLWWLRLSVCWCRCRWCRTWDDHDRSGRYTTRDFGNNYLNSLDENAIVFTNGDNDTFPLVCSRRWRVRTDAKVANLSYLTTDWYVDQVRRPSL